MVSEGTRPWGRGRSEFAESLGVGVRSKNVREKFCAGDFAPPKPEFGPEFWEPNFGRPNFGPEFLGRMF